MLRRNHSASRATLPPRGPALARPDCRRSLVRFLVVSPSALGQERSRAPRARPRSSSTSLRSFASPEGVGGFAGVGEPDSGPQSRRHRCTYVPNSTFVHYMTTELTCRSSSVPAANSPLGDIGSYVVSCPCQEVGAPATDSARHSGQWRCRRAWAPSFASRIAAARSRIPPSASNATAPSEELSNRHDAASSQLRRRRDGSSRPIRQPLGPCGGSHPWQSLGLVRGRALPI